VLALVAVGFLGASMSVVTADAYVWRPLTAKPQKRSSSARAAYVQPSTSSNQQFGAPGCWVDADKTTGWANVPSPLNFNTDTGQIFLTRVQNGYGCDAQTQVLGDLADALGKFPGSVGSGGGLPSYPVNSMGWWLATMNANIGTAATGADSLSSQLQALRDRVGRCSGSPCAYSDARSLGGILVTVESNTHDLGAKLDTLHSDLVALRASSATPASSGTPAGPLPGASDAQPSYVRFATSDQTYNLMHTDVWWALGLAVGLWFASRLYRAVSPRA
jgi:hypothetical protein